MPCKVCQADLITGVRFYGPVSHVMCAEADLFKRNVVYPPIRPMTCRCRRTHYRCYYDIVHKPRIQTKQVQLGAALSSPEKTCRCRSGYIIVYKPLIPTKFKGRCVEFTGVGNGNHVQFRMEIIECAGWDGACVQSVTDTVWPGGAIHMPNKLSGETGRRVV